MAKQKIASQVPENRVRFDNAKSINSSGQYVLYWMIANRRGGWNFSLQRAAEWAERLGKPLVIFEALRAGYEWNCDRIHAYVIQGMQANRRHFAGKPVLYYPYLEPVAGDGRGAVATLAKHSCVVVTDDFPCFFVPRMLASAERQIDVRMEMVDSNGLFPMRATDKLFSRAYDFRRFLQKSLLTHLSHIPQPDPLTNRNLVRPHQLPDEFQQQWPIADLDSFHNDWSPLKRFDIDHSVAPIAEHGGSEAAATRLAEFLKRRLPIYGEQRNEPEVKATSEFSGYLHFGHLSVHEIFSKIVRQFGWTPDKTAPKPTGSAQGWWGLPETVECFLDELITWREIGYNMCCLQPNYDQYESLPDWARTTLEEHANDPRPFVYTLEQLEQSQSHDALWNAAQTQLVLEGRIHNYLRMLWGKKIFEWSSSPREALQRLIHLNNKYAIDGRNPNSYSGIFWVLGRYDRAWGPERPIYGKIRYMTSDNTARKVAVKQYIKQYTRL